MRGFTLIELIMTISIVGILAFVVSTQFSSYDEIKAATEVRLMIADIRYVQKTGITYLPDPPNPDIMYVAGIKFKTNSYELYKNISGAEVLDKSVSLSAVTLGSPAVNLVGFNSLGSPVDSALLKIESQNIPVYVNGVLYQTISISKETGSISIL